MHLMIQVSLGSLFEWHKLFAAKNTAQTVALFAKDDLMSPLVGGKCGLHTADTAACDKDFLQMLGRSVVLHLVFIAYFRVDGASVIGTLHMVRIAGETAHTLVDLVFLAEHCLDWNIRIGDKTAGNFNNISLACSNDLLHQLRVCKSADSCHRSFYILFDLCGVLDIYSIGLEHTGRHNGNGQRHLVAAGGNMNKVAMPVYLLGYLNAVIYTVAAVITLRAAYTHLKSHIGAFFSYFIAYRHRKSGAVFY